MVDSGRFWMCRSGDGSCFENDRTVAVVGSVRVIRLAARDLRRGGGVLTQRRQGEQDQPDGLMWMVQFHQRRQVGRNKGVPVVGATTSRAVVRSGRTAMNGRGTADNIPGSESVVRWSAVMSLSEAGDVEIRSLDRGPYRRFKKTRKKREKKSGRRRVAANTKKRGAAGRATERTMDTGIGQKGQLN